MLSDFPDFVELNEIYACLSSLGSAGRVREEAWIEHRGRLYPIHSFHFGPEDPTLPTLVFVAGVHGLEKIGTHIVSSFLKSLIRLLQWDRSLIHVLREARILFLPLVNPVGMHANTRANGQGVDLMRNAPLEAEKEGLPLVRGHRISRHLPWYRGQAAAPMETEAQVLCDFIRRHCFPSSISIVLDLHSGFGLVDRLWFPFAFSSRPFPEAPRILALKKLLDVSYPHHVYAVEPQYHSYTTHGDLWDYLYLEHAAERSRGTFLPLSLEMGSWTWVRKNPRQLFSSLGMFNPVLPHRVQRAERRHFLLLNFLIKAIVSSEEWAHLSPSRLNFFEKKAHRLWYER